MKTTNTTTAAARIAAAVKAIRDPRTPHSFTARIIRVLERMNAYTIPTAAAVTTTTAAATNRKATTTAPINHRAEEAAAGRAVFSGPVYDLARRVVAAKIKGAIRRGATADKNVYIRHYADMIQTAALAISEAEAEAAQYTVMIPAELEGDYYADHHSAFIEACRACGRLEKRIVTRSAKEGTPVEHVHERSATSAAERRLAETSAVMDWTERALEAIAERERMGKCTAKQAQDMKRMVEGHGEKVKNPSSVKPYLVKVLVKAGLLKVTSAGKLELVTD